MQRVNRARVLVEGNVTGEISAGIVVLLGVGRNDTSQDVAYLADKISNLRIFEDELGKMNRSLLETEGSALVVSQFTLYADTRGGRRPSFTNAATPEQARALYEEFVAALGALGIRVETGIFQETMLVELANDGPVTILLDSEKSI